MVNSRLIMDQMYEFEHILSMLTQNKWHPSLINSHPHGDFKKNIKHCKDGLSFKDLGKHLLVEEQYHLENKANDDTSKVHVMVEKRESSKALERTVGTMTRTTRSLKRTNRMLSATTARSRDILSMNVAL